MRGKLIAMALVSALAGAMPQGAMLAGSTVHPVATRKAKTPRQRASSQISEWGYSSGPGWTPAQVKRMATKRRNQARHKAARKGR